jgi:hypothetical protein
MARPYATESSEIVASVEVDMDRTAELPVLEYAMELLPPGRRGPRRWRWELWEGDRLLGAGWHPVPRRAHLALRAAASRRMHERLGVRVLHGVRHVRSTPTVPVPGATFALELGPASCVLAPRRAAAA